MEAAWESMDDKALRSWLIQNGGLPPGPMYRVKYLKIAKERAAQEGGADPPDAPAVTEPRAGDGNTLSPVHEPPSKPRVLVATRYSNLLVAEHMMNRRKQHGGALTHA